MKNLSRRSLLSLVTAILLLTVLAVAGVGAGVGAGAAALAGQPYPGPPPEFPAAPVHSSASTADVETAAYLPIIRTGGKSSSWLDIQNRAASKQFYLEDYGPEHEPIEWTGSHASCDQG